MIPRFIVKEIRKQLEEPEPIFFQPQPEPELPLILNKKQYEIGDSVIGHGLGLLIISDIVLDKSQIEMGMFVAKNTVSPIFYKRFIERHSPRLRLGKHKTFNPNTWDIEKFQLSTRLKRALLLQRKKTPNRHIEVTIDTWKRGGPTLQRPPWVVSWKPTIRLILL